MTSTETKQTTREIAGHSFNLIEGRRYLATRPMASRKGQRFTVSITDHTIRQTIASVHETRRTVATVPDLSYDEANELLAAFNASESTWEGRVWA